MKIKNGSCAAEVVKLLDFPYCYNKKSTETYLQVSSTFRVGLLFNSQQLVGESKRIGIKKKGKSASSPPTYHFAYHFYNKTQMAHRHSYKLYISNT